MNRGSALITYKYLHLSGAHQHTQTHTHTYVRYPPPLSYSHTMNTIDNTHSNDKIRRFILRLEDTLICGMVALDTTLPPSSLSAYL